MAYPEDYPENSTMYAKRQHREAPSPIAQDFQGRAELQRAQKVSRCASAHIGATGKVHGMNGV